MAVADYNFASTRNEIIQRAFRIVGDLPDGQVLTAGQLDQGIKILNQLVNTWQTGHIHLWNVTNKQITLVDGTTSYSLGTDPLVIQIDQVNYKLSGVERPLNVLQWTEYQEISKKAAIGAPTDVAVNHQTPLYLYVYPVPDASAATGTIECLVTSKAKDWDTSAGTGNLPERFKDALIYGIAANLADEYGAPIGERKFLSEKYLFLYEEAKRSDRDSESETFVEPAFTTRRRR